MDPQRIRTKVLDILSQLYVPVSPDDVSLCAEVGTGVNLSEEKVTCIARQDFQGFSSGTGRDIWICPALEYPNGSASHDYLTRSDWPTRTRIVEGVLSEAQEIMLLRNLCDIALVASPPPAATREPASARTPRASRLRLRRRRTP